MTPLEQISEWQKGCSCSRPGKPKECLECTRGLIEALEKSIRRTVMTDKRDEELTERLKEAEKAALAKREGALKNQILEDLPWKEISEKEMGIDAVMATLRKDMMTARNNAQLLTQQSNRLKEQADYWTGVHERLASVVTFYVNGRIQIGEVEKI